MNGLELRHPVQQVINEDETIFPSVKEIALKALPEQVICLTDAESADAQTELRRVVMDYSSEPIRPVATGLVKGIASRINRLAIKNCGDCSNQDCNYRE
ncbi:hypothetical protein ACFL3T_00230 [Patescibacteria group bacterium]